MPDPAKKSFNNAEDLTPSYLRELRERLLLIENRLLGTNEVSKRAALERELVELQSNARALVKQIKDVGANLGEMRDETAALEDAFARAVLFRKENKALSASKSILNASHHDKPFSVSDFGGAALAKLSSDPPPTISMVVDSDIDPDALAEFLAEISAVYSELSEGDELIIREGKMPVGEEAFA